MTSQDNQAIPLCKRRPPRMEMPCLGDGGGLVRWTLMTIVKSQLRILVSHSKILCPQQWGVKVEEKPPCGSLVMSERPG